MSCIHNYVFTYIYKANLDEFNKILKKNKYDFFDYKKIDDKTYIIDWKLNNIKEPNVNTLKAITKDDIDEMNFYVNNYFFKGIRAN